jgi:hypothetical protein
MTYIWSELNCMLVANISVIAKFMEFNNAVIIKILEVISY